MASIKTLEELADQRRTLRSNLLSHPLFSQINTLPRLRHFMETHAFVVWDFMSLIKRLQRELTGFDLPWLPPKDPIAARLVNEIVLSEESDQDGLGGFASHFDIYLVAMEEVGANTTIVRNFVRSLEDGQDVFQILGSGELPKHISNFVTSTLKLALFGRREEVLGAFFYGREELIPQMFQSLLQSWGICASTAPRLCYYLERHIHLDQDQHGPAASRLMDRWIGDDQECKRSLLNASCQAITHRINLWDGVLTGFH